MDTHSLTFFRYCEMYQQSSKSLQTTLILYEKEINFKDSKNLYNFFFKTSYFFRDTKTMMTEKPAEPECTCRKVFK